MPPCRTSPNAARKNGPASARDRGRRRCALRRGRLGHDHHGPGGAARPTEPRAGLRLFQGQGRPAPRAGRALARHAADAVRRRARQGQRGIDEVEAIGRAYVAFSREMPHYFDACARYQSHARRKPAPDAAIPPNEAACMSAGHRVHEVDRRVAEPRRRRRLDPRRPRRSLRDRAVAVGVHARRDPDRIDQGRADRARGHVPVQPFIDHSFASRPCARCDPDARDDMHGRAPAVLAGRRASCAAAAVAYRAPSAPSAGVTPPRLLPDAGDTVEDGLRQVLDDALAANLELRAGGASVQQRVAALDRRARATCRCSTSTRATRSPTAAEPSSSRSATC